MPNRLIDSTSPYLLQHAHNPVEWYPWGAEAIERARREGKPIFLSVGYAACHWCHVMEHLVFERPDIAAVMNEHFINIKVDREERPDLDELYMLATQLMTGQGGWPMSVWLTPALEPFYAGTYFPPEDAYGRPGFPRLLTALADAWKNRRGDLLKQSQKVVEAIRLHADETQGDSTRSVREGQWGDADAADVPLAAWLRLAIEQSADRFDEVNGGLGGAPKFPPHQQLQLWLALVQNETAQKILSPGDRQILAGKITKTLDGMMNGGIYDHVAGGFARYSTDDAWLVPHFEKMLYDNAQLAPLYATASVVFSRPDYARAALETLDFFIREMISADGAFYSSLDADSEGEEGKYYVWTLDDIHAALPNADDAALVIRHFNMTKEGNWHESPVPNGTVLATQNRTRSVSEGAEDRARIDGLLLKMRTHREKRERPRLDDKILTAWNGLMLSALAIAGRVLDEPKYLVAARQLATFLLAHHTKDGVLLRVSRAGPAHTEAFLDDHAFLLNGILDLLEIDRADTPLLDRAVQLADTLLNDFQDSERGGFFFTGPRHEQLFARMKNAADNATPSPNGVAIRALLRLARVSGNQGYSDVAKHAVSAFHPHIARRPEYFPTTLLGLLEDASPETLQSPAPAEPALPDAGSHLTLTLESVEAVADPADPGARVFQFSFHLAIAPGFHIQPADATEPNIKTVARLRVAQGHAEIRSQKWTFPQPDRIHNTVGYAGTLDLKATLTFARLEPGPLLLHATVTAQACTEAACLAPESTTLEIPLECGV